MRLDRYEKSSEVCRLIGSGDESGSSDDYLNKKFYQTLCQPWQKFYPREDPASSHAFVHQALYLPISQ
ncbi:MAG: hypothetical protein U0V70_04395 [Terriglobia bacterium]